MRHSLLATAAAVITAVGGITPALAISYDYIEGRYTIDGDADDGDVQGFGLEASRALDDRIFIRATADLYDVDADASTDTEVPVDLYSIGPGVRVPLTTGPYALDLWGQVNLQRVAAGRSDTGLGIDAGLNMQLSDRLEGRFSVTGVDDSDIELDLYEFRAVYALDEDFDLTGSLVNGDASVDGDEKVDLDNLLRLGVRFRF